MTEERAVVCALCLNPHKVVFDYESNDLTQGVNCAASVWQLRRPMFGLPAGAWVLQGHYGSDFDTSIYQWIHDRPDDRIDPVCDACICRLIAQGALKFLEDGVI